jgi:hypothetical protein
MLLCQSGCRVLFNNNLIWGDCCWCRGGPWSLRHLPRPPALSIGADVWWSSLIEDDDHLFDRWRCCSSVLVTAAALIAADHRCWSRQRRRPHADLRLWQGPASLQPQLRCHPRCSTNVRNQWGGGMCDRGQQQVPRALVWMSPCCLFIQRAVHPILLCGVCGCVCLCACVCLCVWHAVVLLLLPGRVQLVGAACCLALAAMAVSYWPRRCA